MSSEQTLKDMNDAVLAGIADQNCGEALTRAKSLQVRLNAKDGPPGHEWIAVGLTINSVFHYIGTNQAELRGVPVDIVKRGVLQ